MDNNFLQTAEELLSLNQKIAFLKTKHRDLSVMLREICHNETGTECGYKYLKITRPGSIKYKEIEILKGLNLDRYRGDPVVTWKLSFQRQFENILEDK